MDNYDLSGHNLGQLIADDEIKPVLNTIMRACIQYTREVPITAEYLKSPGISQVGKDKLLEVISQLDEAIITSLAICDSYLNNLYQDSKKETK